MTQGSRDPLVLPSAASDLGEVAQAVELFVVLVLVGAVALLADFPTLLTLEALVVIVRDLPGSDRCSRPKLSVCVDTGDEALDDVREEPRES